MKLAIGELTLMISLAFVSNDQALSVAVRDTTMEAEMAAIDRNMHDAMNILDISQYNFDKISVEKEIGSIYKVNIDGLFEMKVELEQKMVDNMCQTTFWMKDKTEKFTVFDKGASLCDSTYLQSVLPSGTTILDKFTLGKNGDHFDVFMGLEKDPSKLMPIKVGAVDPTIVAPAVCELINIKGGLTLQKTSACKLEPSTPNTKPPPTEQDKGTVRFTISGMKENPEVAPESHNNVEGNWYRCTHELCGSSAGIENAQLVNGFHQLTNAGRTRYVYTNDHGMMAAVNELDSVMSLYMPGQRIGHQGGRTGYIWGYGTGKMATAFTGASGKSGNIVCSTCKVTAENGENIFQNL